MSTQRLALWVVVVSLVLWGVGLLVVPGFIWETLGGADPVSPMYSRYGGAWFVAVAVAAWTALRGASSSRPILLITFIGGALTAVVLLVDQLAGDNPGTNDWVTWLAIADGAVVAVLSWIALRPEREAGRVT